MFNNAELSNSLTNGPLLNFEAFQFVNFDIMTTKLRFDVIQLEIVGWFFNKHQIGVNQFKYYVFTCIFEQKKLACIWNQIFDCKIKFI